MSDLKLPRGTRLVIATHNEGKLAEFKTLFATFGLDLVSAGDLGLDEPEETGATFVENACIKAQAAARQTGLLALADDSGLCVDALNGQPGIHTARWAEKADGSGRDFDLGMQRVEDELRAARLNGNKERGGAFCATLCLADAHGNDRIFEGVVRGTLVWPPRGELGFGFDPVFMPDGLGITFGEMPADEKHSWSPGKPGLSHRARAFAALVNACCNV